MKTTTHEVISRADAKSRGLAHYFTGKACKHGHVGHRYTSTGQCCQCVAALKGTYPTTDKARAGAARRNQRWGLKNRARKAEALKKWRAENPELSRAVVANRRAKKQQAMPPWFGEFDELVMLEAAHLAHLRERVTGKPWHVDHMVPLQARQACGLHCAQNIQVIPESLNVRKGNKMQLTAPGEWINAI